jgi:hypothetical protein
MRELGKAEHIADSLCSARAVLLVVPPQKFDQHDPVRPRSYRRAESAVSCLAGWSVRCSLVETIITHTFRGIKVNRLGDCGFNTTECGSGLLPQME